MRHVWVVLCGCLYVRVKCIGLGVCVRNPSLYPTNDFSPAVPSLHDKPGIHKDMNNLKSTDGMHSVGRAPRPGGDNDHNGRPRTKSYSQGLPRVYDHFFPPAPTCHYFHLPLQLFILREAQLSRQFFHPYSLNADPINENVHEL